MRQSFALLALVSLSLPAAAQTTTVPAAYTNSPAPSSTAYPFGYTAPMRVQVLYAASETGVANPVLLRGLEVRALPSASNPAKSGIDIQISLSASPYVRNTMTVTYAQNHGPNLTTVYNRKLTSVNATTPSFIGQGSGMLPFDQPFIYNPTAGSLLVDFDVANTNATGWSISSAASVPASAAQSNLGTGCNGLNLSSSGGGNTYTLTYTLSGGPANAPGLFFIAPRPLATPIPIPGNPTCSLYQEILIILSATLNASGGWTLPMTYAPDPGLRGVTLYGQLAAFRNFSPLTIDTSNSRVVTLTDAHDGGRLYTLGNNTSPTGTLQLGSMIVIVFQN